MSTNPRQSFRLKLCLWIFSISVVTFTLIFCACIYFIRQEVKTEVDGVVNAKLDYALRSIDEGLTNTQVVADNFAGILMSPLVKQQPDSIMSLCQYFMYGNPRVQGIAIGYEPGVINNNSKGFAPYIMRVKSKTSTGTKIEYVKHDLALIKDYRSADWYKTPMTTGKTYWSNPFVETNGTMITSYCVPLRRGDKIVGVLAVDLNLNVIADRIQELRPYPTSSLTLTDRNGYFIAHANRDFIMKESLESLIKKAPYAPNLSILEKIKSHQRGMESYDSDKDEMFLYFAPEPTTGWTVTLDVPRSEIAKGYDQMFKALLFEMCLGIILLLIVSWVIITKLVRPLETFAGVARQISHGDFNVQLPVITDHNELYDLRQALASMEMSLNKYIKELRDTMESKAALESELNIARNIQLSMVPKIFPPYPDRHDIDIHASLTPAKAVGGDLYDFFLDGSDLYFCIGDVSGKGVPASLFMAITRSLFRNTAINEKTPAKIAKALNNALVQGNDEGMFVTMIIGKASLDTGVFTCCNCGHNAPVTNGILDIKTMHATPSGEAHYMSMLPTNIAVGVIEDFDYKEVTITIDKDVALFLYTDGVTEAESTEKVLYGDDRLVECIKKCGKGSSAETLVHTVVDDVHRHAEGAEQSDDITILCFRYKP